VSIQPNIEIPAYQNILQYTADFIFKNFSEHLTASSLSNSSLFVLLPAPQVAEQFTPALYHSIPSETSAIIPPWSGTLKNWATTFVTNPKSDEVINHPTRQLLFIEALQRHPSLFKEENQWQVAQALLDYLMISTSIKNNSLTPLKNGRNNSSKPMV
jgi:hypothetical protein